MMSRARKYKVALVYILISLIVLENYKQVFFKFSRPALMRFEIGLLIVVLFYYFLQEITNL